MKDIFDIVLEDSQNIKKTIQVKPTTKASKVKKNYDIDKYYDKGILPIGKVPNRLIKDELDYYTIYIGKAPKYKESMNIVSIYGHKDDYKLSKLMRACRFVKGWQLPININVLDYVNINEFDLYNGYFNLDDENLIDKYGLFSRSNNAETIFNHIEYNDDNGTQFRMLVPSHIYYNPNKNIQDSFIANIKQTYSPRSHYQTVDIPIEISKFIWTNDFKYSKNDTDIYNKEKLPFYPSEMHRVGLMAATDYNNIYSNSYTKEGSKDKVQRIIERHNAAISEIRENVKYEPIEIGTIKAEYFSPDSIDRVPPVLSINILDIIHYNRIYNVYTPKYIANEIINQFSTNIEKLARLNLELMDKNERHRVATIASNNNLAIHQLYFLSKPMKEITYFIAEVGTGKTRTAFSYWEFRGQKRALFVTTRRLILEIQSDEKIMEQYGKYIIFGLGRKGYIKEWLMTTNKMLVIDFKDLDKVLQNNVNIDLIILDEIDSYGKANLNTAYKIRNMKINATTNNIMAMSGTANMSMLYLPNLILKNRNNTSMLIRDVIYDNDMNDAVAPLDTEYDQEHTYIRVKPYSTRNYNPINIKYEISTNTVEINHINTRHLARKVAITNLVGYSKLNRERVHICKILHHEVVNLITNSLSIQINSDIKNISNRYYIIDENKMLPSILDSYLTILEAKFTVLTGTIPVANSEFAILPGYRRINTQRKYNISTYQLDYIYTYRELMLYPTMSFTANNLLFSEYGYKLNEIKTDENDIVRINAPLKYNTYNIDLTQAITVKKDKMTSFEIGLLYLHLDFSKYNTKDVDAFDTQAHNGRISQAIMQNKLGITTEIDFDIEKYKYNAINDAAKYNDNTIIINKDDVTYLNNFTKQAMIEKVSVNFDIEESEIVSRKWLEYMTGISLDKIKDDIHEILENSDIKLKSITDINNVYNLRNKFTWNARPSWATAALDVNTLYLYNKKNNRIYVITGSWESDSYSQYLYRNATHQFGILTLRDYDNNVVIPNNYKYAKKASNLYHNITKIHNRLEPWIYPNPFFDVSIDESMAIYNNAITKATLTKINDDIIMQSDDNLEHHLNRVHRLIKEGAIKDANELILINTIPIVKKIGGILSYHHLDVGNRTIDERYFKFAAIRISNLGQSKYNFETIALENVKQYLQEARETIKEYPEYVIGNLYGRQQNFIPVIEKNRVTQWKKASTMQLPELRADGKYDEILVSKISDIIKNRKYSPIVIFTASTNISKIVGKIINEQLPDIQVDYIDAKTKIGQERKTLENNSHVYITTYNILQRGFNLNNIRTVILYDVPLSKAEEKQAIGRIERPNSPDKTYAFIVSPNVILDEYDAPSLEHASWILKSIRAALKTPTDIFRTMAQFLLDLLIERGIFSTDVSCAYPDLSNKVKKIHENEYQSIYKVMDELITRVKDMQILEDHIIKAINDALKE